MLSSISYYRMPYQPIRQYNIRLMSEHTISYHVMFVYDALLDNVVVWRDAQKEVSHRMGLVWFALCSALRLSRQLTMQV